MATEDNLVCVVCNGRLDTPIRLYGYEDGSVDCPRCGRYDFTYEARLDFLKDRLSSRQRANLSGWLARNRGFKIRSQDEDRLKAIKAPSVVERMDLLLLEISGADEPLDVVSFSPRFVSTSWSADENEARALLRLLQERGLLTDPVAVLSGFEFEITAAGWQKIEELQRTNRESNQGFVAMWFDPSMKNVYEQAIEPGILDAGFDSFKVDLSEHNNKIDDEIIAQIRRSHFVVADFTDHRGGVYYEAGFAQGLGLEVIWTCREDDLPRLHFDVRQYNCIVWSQDALPEFRKRLAFRIESILGRGARKY